MLVGQYLLLFYNNLGRAGEGRNPYWLAAGIEAGGEILWSAPEVILYDRYHSVPEAGGYPDFIQDPEDERKIYIMETNKKVARLHLIEEETLSGLFTQHSRAELPRQPSANFSSCAFINPGHSCEDTIKIPKLVSFETVHHAQQGFSLEMLLAWHTGASEGDVIFDARDKETGMGVAVVVPSDGGLALVMSGSTPDTTFHPGAQKNLTTTVTMDPGCAALLLADNFQHHVVIIADAGPLIVMFLVDGQFCDGAGVSSSGWQFIPPYRRLGDARRAQIAPRYGGELHGGKIYDRSLRVSEGVASYRAPRQHGPDRAYSSIAD